MSVRCGKGHVHPDVAAVRVCYHGPDATPVRVRAGSVTGDGATFVRFTESPPTDRQLEAIRRLGGVVPDGCTRGQASSIISKLHNRDRDKVIPMTETQNIERPFNIPGMPGSVRLRGDFPFPAQLLFNIREARYAVSVDGSDNLTFVRVSLIKPFKNGRPRAFQGCVKIQTQHSDDLIDRVVVEPGGRYLLFSNSMREKAVAGIAALIAIDQRGAAARYGQRLGQCCRCGKTLTDERSRWYGIGPECEKHWEEIVNDSDEARGVFVPSGVNLQ